MNVEIRKRCALIPAVALIVTSILLLVVCEKNDSDPIRISVNNWIGYTPIFYIHEKGWAGKDLRFATVSSLLESEKMFQAGMTDGFAGTQYEYYHGHAVSQSLVPAILINRSVGADGILSNVGLDALKKTKSEIPVYMEIQTVNNSLFSSFVKEYGLERLSFRKVNMDQASMAAMKPPATEETSILLITYEPYKTELKNNGFIEIASTRNIKLLVLDAIFLEEEVLDRKTETVLAFKKNLERAIAALREDPKEFYETVKPYLGNQTLAEFLSSLEGIEWLIAADSRWIDATLKENGIPPNRLIR